MFHMVHSSHGSMNSVIWAGLNLWAFIAQLVEYCRANAESTGSNPVEAPKNFLEGLIAITTAMVRSSFSD